MTMIDRDELLKKIAPMGLSNGSVLGHHSGTADVIAEMIQNSPTIDPAVIPDAQRWRDPDKDPPKVETEVLILYRRYGYLGITTAHYEDGNVFSENSEWNWKDLPDWGTYDEERDDYKIPEGWWEYRHFNQDDVYNNKIDCAVVGWMPLPPKEITK